MLVNAMLLVADALFSIFSQVHTHTHTCCKVLDLTHCYFRHTNLGLFPTFLLQRMLSVCRVRTLRYIIESEPQEQANQTEIIIVFP